MGADPPGQQYELQTTLQSYLTLPYLHGDRVIKATWPGDPVLIELSKKDRQDSYWSGMMYVRFAQCRSSLALNWLTDEADTTEAGSEFQSFMILVLKVFLRVSDLALGFSSFHWCPLVRSALFLVRNIS